MKILSGALPIFSKFIFFEWCSHFKNSKNFIRYLEMTNIFFENRKFSEDAPNLFFLRAVPIFVKIIFLAWWDVKRSNFPKFVFFQISKILSGTFWWGNYFFGRQKFFPEYFFEGCLHFKDSNFFFENCF